ncbi:MAG: hypothetical protein H6Q86_2916 [candidate division NC10 bacterium]|nr:hypothetical protein [candidate division NC10 bacterium]
MKRTLQRRQPTPTEVSVGQTEEPTRSIAGEGLGSGEGSGKCTQVSSRRTGGGTCGRNTDPKQGTSRGRPIGKDPPYNRWTAGKWERACKRDGSGRSSEDVRGQHNLRRAKGPWAYVVSKGWRGRSGHTARSTGTNRARSQQERRVRQTADIGRAHLTVGHAGLKPYWGKPAVRNVRGARGNGARGSVSRARSRKRRIQPSARLQPLRLGSTRRIAVGIE